MKSFKKSEKKCSEINERIIIVLLIFAIVLSVFSICLSICFESGCNYFSKNSSKPIDSSSAQVGLIIQEMGAILQGFNKI